MHVQRHPSQSTAKGFNPLVLRCDLIRKLAIAHPYNDVVDESSRLPSDPNRHATAAAPIAITPILKNGATPDKFCLSA